MPVVFEWEFTFRTASILAANPVVCYVQDVESGGAYDWGIDPDLRLVFGTHRVGGLIENPLGIFTSGDGSISHVVETISGATWNVFTFDPEPGSALHQQVQGRYIFDLEIRPEHLDDFDAIAEGEIRLSAALTLGWPESLPSPVVEGASRALVEPFQTFQADKPTAGKRRRVVSGRRSVDLHLPFFMTVEEWNTLDAFFFDEPPDGTDGGVEWFAITDCLTGTNCEGRFIAPPFLSELAGDRHDVSVRLRLRPL